MYGKMYPPTPPQTWECSSASGRLSVTISKYSLGSVPALAKDLYCNDDSHNYESLSKGFHLAKKHNRCLGKHLHIHRA